MLHYTAMASAGEALARLCDPASEVSAHYLIDDDGTVLRLVREDLRAWHAGAGRWGRVTDVNSRSIGIELQNAGQGPYAPVQMRALMRLLDDILARHAIPPERVIGHSDMAPLRKADPGPWFDWRALAKAGLSVWPGPDATGDFRAGATGFGYDPDVPEPALLTAFRLRFRPFHKGPQDQMDGALATSLAARWPVDGGRAHPYLDRADGRTAAGGDMPPEESPGSTGHGAR